MDVIIAGFSDAARRHKELISELSRRTSSKVSIDTEMRRVVVKTKDLKTVVRTPGIDRAAEAYEADKDPKDIAKKIVKLLRKLEDELEITIAKYSIELHAEDSRLLDLIAREVFSQASYRASPESPYKVYVDVIGSGAYVYLERVPGPGGLPLGVSGSAIAMISGSIDSFVSAYMAMRRGFRIIGVYPILTLRGKSLLPRVERLASSIDETFVIKPLELMDDYQELLEEVQSLELDDYAGIALKLRVVKRISEEARRIGIKNVVIGDVLSQSPTQTPKILRAENIIARELGVHLFRPILASTNSELLRRAEFLELEDAKDPIDLPAPRKVDDDTLKMIIELVLGL